MAKWVKWNIRVEHDVVFLRLSLFWGFSEDVLYLDNYTTLFCFFEYWYICVLHSIFFEMFVSEIIYFILQIVMEQSVWHSLSLRNNLFVLGRRITAIVLWAKPFGCEKLNKRDFKLLSRCFFHLCISLYSLNWDVLSPDLFSHGSRSSTSRSDLLKLPTNKNTTAELYVNSNIM